MKPLALRPPSGYISSIPPAPPLAGSLSMRLALWVAVAAGIFGIANLLAPAPRAATATEPVAKPYGLEKRELWTTSKVKGSPEPPAPYRMAKVYPKWKFFEALELVPVPGKKAWVVAERPGKVHVFDA